MDIKSNILQKLYVIHRTRNRLGYIPNPVAIAISTYFQRQSLAIDARWWAAILCVLVGTLIRILIGEVFFEKWKKEVTWTRTLNLIGFLLLGLGWGIHFNDVYFHYGSASANVSYTLLIVVSFMTGSSSSLVGDKQSYFAFVTSIVVLVAFTYMADPHLENSYIILNIILFSFFSISNFKLGHSQLLELLERQIKSEFETSRLQNIINAIPGFAGLVDKDLIIYMANQTTLTMYPDIIGKKIGTNDPNSGWEKTVIDFMKSTRLSSISEEHTVFQEQDIYALLNIQRMEDGGAIIVSIVTTELVEARKLLREQEAKAQYSAKLASLGEMAAGIAHEVNNPLSIISGSANIVRKLVEKDPIDKANIILLTSKMIDTSDRISKIVKSLKALSRSGDNDPKENVSLKRVVSYAIEVSERRIKKHGLELFYTPLEEDIEINGREVQLGQVIMNLIGNAIDAAKILDEKWIKIDIRPNGKSVDLFIIDSGKGISPEIQKKIMEPFFTTKDVNQGTGLGLSVSQTIIKDHGGELSVISKAPNTTFRVRLPIA